jgi:hypothetical protein
MISLNSMKYLAEIVCNAKLNVQAALNTFFQKRYRITSAFQLQHQT